MPQFCINPMGITLESVDDIADHYDELLTKVKPRITKAGLEHLHSTLLKQIEQVETDLVRFAIKREG